jgi:hypothetical protein
MFAHSTARGGEFSVTGTGIIVMGVPGDLGHFPDSHRISVPPFHGLRRGFERGRREL